MKYVYDSQTDILAPLREFYKEEGGKWLLQCEGAVAASKVADFRDNNVALQKQITELNTKFKDIDPDEARALKDKKAELEAQKSKDKGEIDKVVEDRLKALREQAAKEKGELTAELERVRGQFQKTTLENAVMSEANRLGVRKSAIPDVLSRASQLFTMEGDKLVAKRDGNTVYSKDGVSPLAPGEWMEGLSKEADHLFEPNRGQGAPGGNGNKGGGPVAGVNPWEPGKVNLMQQGVLYKQDPALAISMAALHGVTLPAPPPQAR